LPGAPDWQGQWDTLIARAEQEATALATGGVDALILENFHDTPYTSGRMDTAGAIAMAMLARRIKQFTNLPLGLSVFRNDPETTLAIALNTNADFICLPLLSGALITESGVLNSRFNELIHYKNRLKAPLPPILVDVSLKHLTAAGQMVASGPLEAVDHLLQVARELPDNLDAIALVVSDQELRAEALPAFKLEVNRPVLVAHHSAAMAPDAYFEQADGLILGGNIRKTTSLHPDQPPTIDMTRVEEIVNRLRGVQSLSEMDPDVFLKR
jgi:membrane complex biogenesis BtpA family protein